MHFLSFRNNRPIAGAVLVLLSLVFAAAFLAGCDHDNDWDQSKAYKVKSRSQLIGGPKALGNIGDYILENDKIRVLINGHPSDMAGGGVNKWGGAILDADIQRVEDYFEPAKAGEDRLVELIPIMDVKTFGFDTSIEAGPVLKIPMDAIEIVSKGGDDEPAVIRATGTIHNLLGILQLIPVPLNFLPVRAETTYSLAPGDNYVKINTKFIILDRDGNEAETENPIELRSITDEDNALAAMFTGDAFGDAVFYGDSVDMFGPAVFGFSASFFAEEQFFAGESFLVDTPMMDFSAGVSDEIGYGLVSTDGPIAFPIMESFLTIGFQQITANGPILPEPGDTYSYDRYLIVDEGDAAGILNHVIKLKKWPSATVEGNVFSQTDGSGVSGAKVLVFPHPRLADGSLVNVLPTLEEMNTYLRSLAADEVDFHRLMPYSRFISDGYRLDDVPDGSFEGKLPVDQETGTANYILMASGPSNNHSKLLPIGLKSGEVEKLSLSLPATGKLKITVRSLAQNGPKEPCKIIITGTMGEMAADPFIGESFQPGGIAKVIHTLDGTAEVELLEGAYQILAGRGPEYSADIQTVKVSPMTTREIQMTIARVVDSDGWVACDTHIHTNLSPDGGISIEDRIKSIVVHGLDIVAGTDHDVIANYLPMIEKLGVYNILKYMPGNELSHFSFGHFCSFPLKYDQTKTSGGAPQWRNPSPTANNPKTGEPLPFYTPQDVFDSLRAVGDYEMVNQAPIVIINHTQESITGYLRTFGFEQYSNTFGRPDIIALGDPVVNNGSLFASDATANFSFDFDGIELLNAKRMEDFRTITEEEINGGEFGQPIPGEVPLLPALVRTGDEQVRILAGDLILDHTNRGMIDDYFSLLAMGLRPVGVGVSDSHSGVKTEIGKCRTYVMTTSDDPRFVDMEEYMTNLKAGRAIATTGPFMEMWVDGAPIGSDVYDEDGSVDVRIRVQAPEWMAFDRIEIYGNGILIGEIGADSGNQFLGCYTEGLSIGKANKVIRFDDAVSCDVEEDTFINVIGIGYEGMHPHLTQKDGPAVELTDTLILGVNAILKQALGIANLIPLDGPIERNPQLYPYSVTNAVFVDVDGLDLDMDGRNFDAPGYIPGWFEEDEVDEDLIQDPDIQLSIFAAKERMLSMTSGLKNPMNKVEEAIMMDAEDDSDDDEPMGCGG